MTDDVENVAVEEDTSTELAPQAAIDPDAFEHREKSAREQKIIKVFTTLTGYREHNILEINEDTLTVVTANGGKYQLNRAGTQVRHFSGPAAPRPRRKKGSSPVSSDEE